MTAVTFVKTSR